MDKGGPPALSTGRMALSTSGYSHGASWWQVPVRVPMSQPHNEATVQLLQEGNVWGFADVGS